MSSNTNLNKSHSKLDGSIDIFNHTNHSMISGRSPANINRTFTKSKSSINPKKNVADNEFLNGQLDPSKVEEYISLLSEFEKNCIAEKKFKDADLAAIRVHDLRAQEIEYKSTVVQEKTEAQAEELEKLNVEQFREFNSMWDALIHEHIENIREIEAELLRAQEEELKRFDEEIEKIVIPPPKYSKEILDNRLILKKAYRSQKEAEETQKWYAGYKDRFIKKKGLLIQRHKNELDALQIKLQNSLQEKLRMRQAELQKILQRFQNLKKGLELKQNHEIVKIQLEEKKTKRAAATKTGNSFIADISVNRG